MKKVNKIVARKLYDEGYEIYLLPNKVRLDNQYISPVIVSVDTHHRSFDSVVNQFEYYNCNVELGLYSAYYINEE